MGYSNRSSSQRFFDVHIINGGTRTAFEHIYLRNAHAAMLS
jgi:hypothetical protein